LIVENISDSAPLWGDGNCLQAEGWLTALFMGFVVEEGETPVIVPADYYPRRQVHPGGNL
jgi:hypothetical protein